VSQRPQQQPDFSQVAVVWFALATQRLQPG
jgi:hypothetical protein